MSATWRKDLAGVGALQREGADGAAAVLDGHVVAAAQPIEPGERGLGGGDPKVILIQSRDRAVVHDLAVVVTPTEIGDATDLELVDVLDRDPG